ncbi:Sugar phosphate permease [Pseudomonas sp. 9AZ]|uniref:MFS transporter n=1 Tax=Pseudomonas sp. 9AZ TaxID=2653168 RepID=UPI0012F45BEE|nr:MFS transporter [Pseudomonas sp. 9AZ]VXD04329.1 Sugar phosphate permease [Pseudomonas sp. 9AZ]
MRDNDAIADQHAPETGDSRSRWYVLFLLVCGYAIYTLDKLIISVMIEPIKAEFGISDTTVSLLAGLATTVPFALACIPIGMLADRFNRRNLLVGLIIAWSLMTGMAGMATSIMLLFLSRIGIGAFEAGFSPLSLSIISDTFPRKLRATAMGLYGLGPPIGAFLALTGGSYVVVTYGWRAAFFIAVVPGLLIAALIGLTLLEPQRGRFDPPSPYQASIPLSAVFRHIWQDRALFNILMAMVCCTVVPAVITVWTPSFLIRVHGMSIQQAGLAASIALGLCGGIGAAGSGFIADYLGRNEEWRKLLCPVFGTILSIVLATLTFLIMPGTTTTVVLISLLACFAQFYMGTCYSVVASLCPPAMRGTTLSILLVAFNFGSYGLGVLLLGIINDHLTPWAGNLAIAYGMFASTLFSVIGLGFILRAMWHIRASQASPDALQVTA